MKITGTGSALPEQIVTNDMLSEILDTNDEWISTRTGIKERRIIGQDVIEDLSKDACMQAIQQANLQVSDLDFIICSSVKTQHCVPGVSAIVAKLLGATCPSVDINAGCSGFLYALHMAHAYLNTGMKNVLILCAETPTKLVDWTDRATCVLFGDAAAAVVVTASEDIFDIKMQTKYDDDALYVTNDKGNCPYSTAQPEPRALYMNGQEVYKYAVSTSIADIENIFEKHNLTADDIGTFVLHQANFRIVDAVRKRLKRSAEDFPTNMQYYGNTSSASIPLLLDELNRNGRLKKGERIIMSAFGAGLLSATALLKWGI